MKVKDYYINNYINFITISETNLELKIHDFWFYFKQEVVSLPDADAESLILPKIANPTTSFGAGKICYFNCTM